MQSISNNLQPLSYRQARAVEFFIRDGCKNMGKALRQAKYTESVCRQPQKVFSSVKVKEALKKRGFEIPEVGNVKQEIEEELNTKTFSPTPLFDISKITPEQIKILRERLIGVGYDLYASQKKKENEIPSFVPNDDKLEGCFNLEKSDIETNNFSDFPSFSSI